MATEDRTPLQRIEWRPPGFGIEWRYCPSCGNPEHDEHQDGCDMAAALEEDARLRAALRRYANKDNWIKYSGAAIADTWRPEQNGWHAARVALARVVEEDARLRDIAPAMRRLLKAHGGDWEACTDDACVEAIAVVRAAEANDA